MPNIPITISNIKTAGTNINSAETVFIFAKCNINPKKVGFSYQKSGFFVVKKWVFPD